jgi:hypothetical protein
MYRSRNRIKYLPETCISMTTEEKYDWSYKETDPSVLHLNILHKVKTCGTCPGFEPRTSKCTKRNCVVNNTSQQCEPGDLPPSKMLQCDVCMAGFFSHEGLFSHPCIGFHPNRSHGHPNRSHGRTKNYHTCHDCGKELKAWHRGVEVHRCTSCGRKNAANE